MPALPGAQRTSVTAGSRRRARTSACSRAPEPMTRTFTTARTSTTADRWPACRRGAGRVAAGRRPGSTWREAASIGRAGAESRCPGAGDGFLQLRVVALQAGLVLDDPGQRVDLGHQRHRVLVGPLTRDGDRDLVGDHRQLDARPAVGELAGVGGAELLDAVEDLAGPGGDPLPLLQLRRTERAGIPVVRLLGRVQGVREGLPRIAADEVDVVAHAPDASAVPAIRRT